jgi:hypothetical protein
MKAELKIAKLKIEKAESLALMDRSVFSIFNFQFSIPDCSTKVRK